MDLDRAIDALVGDCRREVPDYAGVGVVDLSTGAMLHCDTVAELPAELTELLAASTVDLFAGRAVRHVTAAMAARHDQSDEAGHGFEEILVRSPHVVHLFLRSRRRPDLALGLVCSRSVKVGLLLIRAQQVLRDFDAALADRAGLANGATAAGR
jgi:hypothetical protein